MPAAIRSVLQLKIWRVFKSLRLRLFLIMCLIGLLSCVIIKYAIIKNYEARAFDVKKNEVLAQLQVLSEHVTGQNFLTDQSSKSVNSELELLAALYGGRVLVTNARLEIVYDTERTARGKTLIAQEAVRCYRNATGDAKGNVRKDDALRITSPVLQEVHDADGVKTQEVRGVFYATVSTETIRGTLDILTAKANRLQWIVFLCVILFSAIASELMIKPFDRITRAINEMKLGFTNEPINVPDYLETEHITNAFNQLQSRMQALDASREEFVSNVSHELKTPITSMKVLADSLLMQEDAPPDMVREFLTDISEEIDREDRIINDLLSLVKLDLTAAGLNIRTVNVNDMTEIVLKRLRPIARAHNIELTLESECRIDAEVDEVKLSLAIMNLVENAIKYNNDGGWVNTVLDADLRTFTIKISDSGIGIPEEALPQIFERFYRVDKSRSREIGGTGLGLSVVRQVVLMHRGEIDVQSMEGTGTVFTIRIPLFAQKTDVAETVKAKRRWFS